MPCFHAYPLLLPLPLSIVDRSLKSWSCCGDLGAPGRARRDFQPQSGTPADSLRKGKGLFPAAGAALVHSPSLPAPSEGNILRARGPCSCSPHCCLATHGCVYLGGLGALGRGQGCLQRGGCLEERGIPSKAFFLLQIIFVNSQAPKCPQSGREFQGLLQFLLSGNALETHKALLRQR